MSGLRDRIAVAMSGTEGHFGDKLDAVMAVVQPLVAAGAKFDERLSDLQAEYVKHQQSWDRTRERLTAELAGEREKFALADHTATVMDGEWSKADDECADLRESRFRWAEEAAALQAKLDGPCGSCHPCVNWNATAEPGDAEEALAAALEAHQSSIVTMDDAGPEFDAQYAARIALDLVRSWCASTSNALSNAALPADWRKQIGGCESSGAAVDLVESWQGAGAPLADVPEAEWRQFHEDVTSARGGEAPDEQRCIEDRVDELEMMLNDTPVLPGIGRYSVERLQSLRHMVKHRLRYGDQPMAAGTGTEASDG